LENDIKTPREFAEAILEGTDWKVGEFDDFLEYMSEGVYRCTTKTAISAKTVKANNTTNGTDIVIPEGVNVYIPYSIIQNEKANVHLLYSPLYSSGINVPKDDEGVLSDEYFGNYSFETAEYENGFPKELTAGVFCVDVRGKHYVKTPKTKYDSKIDKYVTIY
jgi:hypothetical protein